jgi:hypothetical protein
MSPSIFNSDVLVSVVTVFGGLAGIYLTYYLSKHKTKVFKGRHKTLTELARNPHYQEYERIIKSQGLELDRLYKRNALVEKRFSDAQEIADKREAILRKELEDVYQQLDEKNSEIGKLRHLREFTQAAKNGDKIEG